MKSIILYITVVGLLVSCQNNNKTEFPVIYVNVDSTKTIDIKEGRLINLETTDSALLYEVSKLEIVKNKMFVHSRSKIVAFDSYGKYLFNLSRKGQGPSEYTQIASFFTRNDSVYIFDSMQKKLLLFDEDGQLLHSIKIPDSQYPIADIQPLTDGKYIAKNMFQGESGVTPLGTLLANNFKSIDILTGLFVNSGFSVYDNFTDYQENIIYVEPLSDTIFHVNRLNQVVPQYVVDFGKHAIPLSERKKGDVYDLVQYTNRPESKDKIACFVGLINEDERYLRFRFLYKGVCYVYYDKQNKVTEIFKLTDSTSNYKLSPYIKYHNGKIYLAVQSEIDIEQNPSFVVFDEKSFTDKLSTK